MMAYKETDYDQRWPPAICLVPIMECLVGLHVGGGAPHAAVTSVGGVPMPHSMPPQSVLGVVHGHAHMHFHAQHPPHFSLPSRAG
eukprot:82984-Chlamydomonas_euryale.AAC.1